VDAAVWWSHTPKAQQKEVRGTRKIESIPRKRKVGKKKKERGGCGKLRREEGSEKK
jgi:hypothetical protein